jgi:hypothetical protein
MEPNSQDSSEFLRQDGRKNFLINPRFQLKFLAYTIGVAIFAIAAFYASDAYFFYKFRELGKGLGLPDDHVFFEFLAERKAQKNVYYAVTATSVIGILTVWGVLMSHRIAGPMYRLRKHLNSVATGETKEDVRFRTGDYFSEVADAYNMQMKKYREALDESSGADRIKAVEDESSSKESKKAA